MSRSCPHSLHALPETPYGTHPLASHPLHRPAGRRALALGRGTPHTAAAVQLQTRRARPPRCCTLRLLDVAGVVPGLCASSFPAETGLLLRGRASAVAGSAAVRPASAAPTLPTCSTHNSPVNLPLCGEEGTSAGQGGGNQRITTCSQPGNCGHHAAPGCSFGSRPLLQLAAMGCRGGTCFILHDTCHAHVPPPTPGRPARPSCAYNPSCATTTCRCAATQHSTQAVESGSKLSHSACPPVATATHTVVHV